MFANVVRNANGVEIAGFISGIDARRWADAECHGYSELTVEDFAGAVTCHTLHKLEIQRTIVSYGLHATETTTDRELSFAHLFL